MSCSEKGKVRGCRKIDSSWPYCVDKTGGLQRCKVMLRKCKAGVIALNRGFGYNGIIRAKGLGFHTAICAGASQTALMAEEKGDYYEAVR